MSRHPVTPMHEADLRRHLAAQTSTSIGLVDLATLNSGQTQSAVESLLTSGNRAIVFDTIGMHTQSTAGAFIWSEAELVAAQNGSLFAIGSSGLTAALISAWRTENRLPEPPAPQPLAPARPLLVVSGSCSEVTRRQIEHALAKGFHGIALDPAALTAANEAARKSAYSAAFTAARHSLAAGRDTLLYTALGPVENSSAAPAAGSNLGCALGALARELVTVSAGTAHPVRRIVFCGGDTSSHATQQLGIFALTWAANLQPGVPLCRAHSEDSALNGLEFVLKGGQVGSEDFFSLVRDGTFRDA